MQQGEFAIIDIDKIIPYQNNPRKNEKAVEALAKSLRANGFRAPILIDEKREILAGHTRYKAAKMIGLKAVPCVIYRDMTENQKRAYRIADNKLNELAQWDFSLLDNEIDNIDWREIEQDAQNLSWEDLAQEELQWPEEMQWDETCLGFSATEAEAMRIDADVGRMIDAFEGSSPVREREQRREDEAREQSERDEQNADEDAHEDGDKITFIAKGYYGDFGADFWRLAGELYARGIKTETKWGK